MDHFSAMDARSGAAASALATNVTPIGPHIERRDGASHFFTNWGMRDPVVLVHSAGAGPHARTYSMIHVVKHGSRFVTFDRRGDGRFRDGGYDCDTLADDLANVMEALDIRDATLVGHAMSCREVVRYVTRHGSKRVARIALATPALPFPLETPDNPVVSSKQYLAALRVKWARQYPKWLAVNAAPFYTPGTSQQMIQWGIRLAYQTSLHAAIESNLCVNEAEFREELKRIDLATLIAQGNADESRPLEIVGKATAKLIPRSELKAHEGVPHGVLLTHVEQLNEDLMRFAR